MSNPFPRRIRSALAALFLLQFPATGVLAGENVRTAASVARAAELAAARARYEQTEREVEAIMRMRREEIRRETGGRLAAGRPKADAGGDATPAPKPPADWSYEGENGPEQWAKLRPDWARCGAGQRQSPIDIRDGIQVDLEPVSFDYRPSSFNVVDTGRTVQVNLAPGNRISLTGRSYALEHFHFHRPAEEKIDGRGFEMVAHLVHRDDEGRMAVVAVLIENGSAHGLLQTVWNNLPLEKHMPVAPPALLDVGQILPQRREYYTYMGSITTPPCSEGVLWIVLKEPVQASARQIGIFSRLYPMNARPVQPSSGRPIKESH
ncbi:MAG TPA: carbonic anhydrase family protein [Noviherbaspirillum sp.]|jgi:carbonic anhydrase|uniref:carbonic anhydrase n=1 Tax=Noviherbaspirillum sp. TaxID=1926288 RepID=UPI002F92E1AC